MDSRLASGFVVDASAVIELLIVGDFVKNTDRLLDSYLEEDLEVFTAAHCPVEVTNALRKIIFRGEASINQAEAALIAFPKFEFSIEPPVPYMIRSWQFRDVMSVYDAAYATIAELRELPLITNDTRLARACAAADISAITLDQI